MQTKCERESITLLSTACSDLVEKQQLGSQSERVRVHAATGIGYLTQANKSGSSSSSSAAAIGGGSSGGALGGAADGTGAGAGTTPSSGQQRAGSDKNEELRVLAERHFISANKIEEIFPMTWIGRGMLNLSVERLEQAKFFFGTTLKQCGQVLPALLGMACVNFKEGNYEESLAMYSKAMTLFPERSGAATRVGFGLACYKLGQVDRARAAFRRAHDMDPDNVEAMVGIAVLDTANLDHRLSKDYRSKSENAIRLISNANMIDHSNAMVQNHLANHYFRRWTPIPAVTAQVQNGSDTMKGSGPINLDIGDRVRIGTSFETTIIDEEDNTTFKLKDTWIAESAEGLKLWKKDYDRVIALAKGAYASTTVQEIQAESLFLHARVYHVKDEMERAKYFYDRACKLAPDLSPARFGLAQTKIWDREYDVAEGELRLVVKKAPSATDAHAALGLLMVKSGKDKKAGFSHIRKAIDLDPSNPDLVLLEAYALQQQESDYASSLDRYTKATKLMEEQGKSISWIVLTNMGVLCYETKKYKDAADCYEKAFRALEAEGNYDANTAKLEVGEGDFTRHEENHMFWKYVDTSATAEFLSSDELGLSWRLDKEIAAVKAGDHVRIGEEFQSEIVSIEGQDIKMKHKYVPPAPKTKAEEDNNNDESSDPKDDEVKMELFVKRANERLSNLSALSIAFNLARLHEAAGRIVAAVELHKAIVKRHPSYVNSYLRLACIARDCGSLVDCSEWLKCACAVAPGNPEVLILVGNLHLSLCDWKPAQRVFTKLLEDNIPNVDAYSMLCLGNIYFDNLKTPERYAKHLGHAADYYRRILQKDNANAYAANGIGTVLAEKGDLPRSKEIFNRVREISGDTIPDALLNLGHIYLALSKHNEALQMYQNYMERTNTAGAQITSKNKDEDDATVLLYVAFAYYDWARQTEDLKDSKSAPADERYRKSIEYIERAIEKGKKENVVMRYNLCIAKLSIANCILRKPEKQLSRTVKEVQEALDGLQESLPKVQAMIQWKKEGKKVTIRTRSLEEFVQNCRANIGNAQSALDDEKNREREAFEKREFQRTQALAKLKEQQLEELMRKEKEAREQEERDEKARLKMEKVNSLVQNWEFEAKMKEEEMKKKKTKGVKETKPEAVAMFDEDSSDEEDNNNMGKTQIQEDATDMFENTENTEKNNSAPPPTDKDLFGDEDSEEEVFNDGEPPQEEKAAAGATKQDLFGDSDSDDDEEQGGQTSSKRHNEDEPSAENGGPQKKRRIEGEEDEAQLE